MILIQIKSDDIDESYVVPFDEALHALENELEILSLLGPGTVKSFEMIEISDEEYAALGEFRGSDYRKGVVNP